MQGNEGCSRWWKSSCGAFVDKLDYDKQKSSQGYMPAWQGDRVYHTISQWCMQFKWLLEKLRGTWRSLPSFKPQSEIFWKQAPAFLFVGITVTFPCSCTLHASGSGRLNPGWTSVMTKALAASVWSIIPGINIHKDTPLYSFFPMVLMVKFQSERESTRQTKNTAGSTFWPVLWLPKLNTLSSFVN